MKFFFDRNACVRTTRMLAIYEGGSRGHTILHHNDDQRFNRRSTDLEIMQALHADDPSWVFVGGDGRILKNRAELAALADCDLTYVLLASTWCNKPIEETCWMAIKGWPSVVRAVERLTAHSILEWKYNANGVLESKGPTASFRAKARRS
jgi:hypothetical protein